MQIVANEARKIYRHQKRSECVADIEVYHLSHEDEHHELWDIVIGLEKEYREVIILYFYDRMQIKEIGKILHISEGTVKSRLFRAKKLLKKRLQKGVIMQDNFEHTLLKMAQKEKLIIPRNLNYRIDSIVDNLPKNSMLKKYH